MYHDQGLPVIKHAGFDSAVNVTLGLPDPAHLRGSRHGAGSRWHRTRRCRAASRSALPSGARHSPPRVAERPVMRARKRFGQHFLHDPDACSIASSQAVSPGPTDHIVEIGPGRGALTRALLDRECALARCHRDRPRSRPAAARGTGERAALHRCTKPMRWSSTSRRWRASAAGKLRVVGNLPYNISTPLLFHLLDHARSHRRHARDAPAGSGQAHRGRARQRRLRPAHHDAVARGSRAESLFDVGPGAFQPPPKVWSAVVRLSVRREPAFAVEPAVCGRGGVRVLPSAQDAAQRAQGRRPGRADRGLQRGPERPPRNAGTRSVQRACATRWAAGRLEPRPCGPE